jgi:hypothetical protein
MLVVQSGANPPMILNQKDAVSTPETGTPNADAALLCEDPQAGGTAPMRAGSGVLRRTGTASWITSKHRKRALFALSCIMAISLLKMAKDG